MPEQPSEPLESANNQPLPEKDIESNQQPAQSNLSSANNSNILDSTLTKIEQALKSKNLPKNLPLTITVGNSSVFKGVFGQEPNNRITTTVNKVTVEQAATLQKTLQEPQGVRGAVRIRVGNETIFHARDGQLKVDRLGLASSSQTQTKQTSQQVDKLNQSQPKEPQPIQSAPASLQEQISFLQATVQQQQQQINVLTQKVERFANSPVVVANEKLNSWFGNLRSKVSSSGQEMAAQLSNQLHQNRTKLASKAQEMFSNTKESIVDGVHATRDRIQSKASEVVLGAMTTATAKLASTIGEKLPDGSVVVENRNLNQRLEVNGSSVALKQRPLLDAQTLWDKYSQDVSAERPIVRSQVVAQKALNDGMTKTAVEDMLSADPKFKQVQQEQGLGKAQAYAKQMTRSASRQEQQANQLGQQQWRDQSNLQR